MSFQSIEIIEIRDQKSTKRLEIHCKIVQDIFVGKQAISLVSPGCAPGVVDQEGTGGFTVAEGVFDPHIIILADSNHYMTPFCLLFRAWEGITSLVSILLKEGNPKKPNIDGISAARYFFTLNRTSSSGKSISCGS